MNDNSKVINQDGSEALDPRKALTEQTLAVDLARADFDQAIATAHRYPRILDTVVKQIETMACYNDEAAENCIYSLPRGGKPIIGPSIGFANILATAWGNCIDAGRPTYVDRKEKLAYGEGIFHDLQTNRRTVIHESRRVSGKNGALYSDDMIAVTGKAAAAVARRNAILNAVPRAIWHPIWEQALRIVRGDVETFAERKEKAMKAFSQFGVKPEQVYMYLGLKGDPDLTLEHIPTLRGMYQALRDGSTTVEEMFDPRRMTGKGFETVLDPLGVDDVVEDGTAGMGDAPQSGAVQANGADGKAAASASAPADAANGPAGKTGAPEPSQASPDLPLASGGGPAAPATDKPAAAPVAAAAAATETAAKVPTNAAEYIEHWRAFCARAMTPAIIKNRYGAERALRKDCSPFSNEEFEEMTHIKDKRIEELGGK